MLVIKNIGNGLALDIRFKCSQEINTSYGLANEKVDLKYHDGGPFINGISSLGPGDTRTIDWGQLGGILKTTEGEEIVIDVEYLNNVGKKINTRCKVDIESFKHNMAYESVQLKIAKNIEKIAKVLDENWNGGPNRS